MYTEIIKIIEAGLQKDPQKVLSYSRLLADNLKKEGDSKLSNRITAVLNKQKSSFVYQDQILSAPVDQESRMNMADIIMPTEQNPLLVINDSLTETINSFIKVQKYKQDIEDKGGEVHSSILLYGQPGCGKTTIAKYIANELKLPLVITRFDSLISSLLGNTAKNIRRLFEYANSKPCILFIDEFDAIAKARDDQHELGELKRVINSLLQNIDEFTQNNNILIAATNHHELLDRAVWRRFNNIVHVVNPEYAEIIKLLNLYFKNTQNDFLENVKKIEIIATALSGLSHANIKTISNNVIANNVINKKDEIKTENVLFQIHLFITNNNYTHTSLIKYLHQNNISQQLIAELLDISTRQVSNHLK